MGSQTLWAKESRSFHKEKTSISQRFLRPRSCEPWAIALVQLLYTQYSLCQY